MKDNISRISWLDNGKAVCMLITILFHTELIYLGKTNLFTNLVFLNTSMVFFFFVSGYLINIQTFSLKKSLTSLVKRLLVPYFIFTTIIYIPKQLIHGWNFDICTMFVDIFGGISNWFVPALIVSKLLLCLILKFTKNVSIIGGVTLIFLVLGFLLTQYFKFPLYWYVNYAFISMFYLFLGVLYREYEDKIRFNKVWQAIISTILFFILAYFDYKIQLSSYIYGLKEGGVEIIEVLAYLSLSVIGIWMVISLMKLIPFGIKWLAYVGVNSLTYYYLNTGLLLVIITIMNKIGFTEISTWFVLPLFFIIVILLTFASEIILRFAPWMVGYTKKTNK